MAIKISFLKLAKQDVNEPFTWYELRRKGLGETFLTEIEKSLQLIGSSPKAYPQKYKRLRAKLVFRFPYALFYKIESTKHVGIYACVHLRRNLSRILENR